MNTFESLPSINDALKAIEQVKHDNMLMGFILHLISIRMLTYGESFEIAASQVQNDQPQQHA